jgi:hypothetical protein
MIVWNHRQGRASISLNSSYYSIDQSTPEDNRKLIDLLLIGYEHTTNSYSVQRGCCCWHLNIHLGVGYRMRGTISEQINYEI